MTSLVRQHPDVRLYYAMARELVDDKNLWDDCVQEAMIHVWRQMQIGISQPSQQRSPRDQPRNESHYRHKVAKRRIQDIARNRPQLGESSRRGYPIDPIRLPHDSWDEIRENQLARER